MTKVFSYISIFFLVGLFTGCSQVLQTVDLDISSEDSSLQEEFNVVWNRIYKSYWTDDLTYVEVTENPIESYEESSY